MSVFGRHIQATAVALNWRRTVVIEQGRWEPRSTAWKPHGDNVRNLRTVHSREPDIVGGVSRRGPAGVIPGSSSYEVTSQHTHFEYEEHTFHNRLFTAKGEGPADLHWPEYTLEPDQRISERRESYHATFSADAGGAEFTTELDEATWRTLKVGRKYRLKVGAFSDKVKQVALAGTSYSYRGRLPDRRERARLGMRTDHRAHQGYGLTISIPPIQSRASADAPLNPEAGSRWTLKRS